jgi:hypothetical protein
MNKATRYDVTIGQTTRSVAARPGSLKSLVATLVVCLLPLAACTDESPTTLVADRTDASFPSPGGVADLAITAATGSSVTLSWTQVEDGSGDPAWYRLKYAEAPIDWSQASIGCTPTLVGDAVGAEMSCTVEGLDPSSGYDFQLMSYRVVDGVWRDARYSNVVSGSTIVGTATVSDLDVVAATESTVTLEWTQVDDGTGQPAWYRVRFAESSLEDWSSGSIGCTPTVEGDEIGASIRCTVEGLTPDVDYAFQLMSFRLENGVWHDAHYSNVAFGGAATGTVGEMPDTASSGSALDSLGMGVGIVHPTVSDLSVEATTESSVTLSWTQVDGGTGGPAWYRMKYAVPPIDWGNATVGCEPNLVGDEIGARMSCTVEGLSAATTYDFQLMSFRLEDGAWADAQYSNIASGSTTPPTSSDVIVGGRTDGLWISQAELAQLPMLGEAWDDLKATADGSCGSVRLNDQEQKNNVCIMAKALVFARTGEATYRSAVVDAIREIASAGTYEGRALALGRELGSYVIAADLIDLPSYDATLDGRFRAALRELRTTYTSGAARNLIDCHEKRPNNWGTHCGATRAAIAVYLGDEADLARTAQVFKGYLGDRSSYAGFDYGDDLSWQCDPDRPVGINPVGCSRSGLSLDGVLPDDQRRGGSFSTDPVNENYVWEALQGALVQAVILQRAGYPTFEWEDRALLRAVRWQYEVNEFPPEGDDLWELYIVNDAYGMTYSVPTSTTSGKNVGWTAWTHR